MNAHAQMKLCEININYSFSVGTMTVENAHLHVLSFTSTFAK